MEMQRDEIQAMVIKVKQMKYCLTLTKERQGNEAAGKENSICNRSAEEFKTVL